MSKNRKTIKPEQGIRLKAWLEETGTTQAELADDIHISQQTISKIINGKSALTESNAAAIARKWPEQNLLAAWLLGKSEFKNSTEKILDGLIKASYSGSNILTGFSCFAKEAGYDVIMKHGDRYEKGTDNEHKLPNMLQSTYIISKHGTVLAEMDLNEMQELQQSFLNSFETRLSDFLKYRKVRKVLPLNDCIIDSSVDTTRFVVENGKVTIIARDENEANKAIHNLFETKLITE